MSFREHVVLIFLEGEPLHMKTPADGTLHVCPHELRVHKGDKVRWLYNQLETFDCKFERDSPFGKDHMDIEGVDGSSPAVVVTAAQGTFSYTVDERHMEKDPIIIVDPSIPK